MPRTAVCPEGHRCPVEERSVAEQIICPVCGTPFAAPPSDSAADRSPDDPDDIPEQAGGEPSRPKGLWTVMSSEQRDSETEAADSEPPASSDRDDSSGQTAGTAGPKGLWSVMQSADAAPEAPQTTSPSSGETAELPTGGRSLWSVMQAGEPRTGETQPESAGLREPEESAQSEASESVVETTEQPPASDAETFDDFDDEVDIPPPSSVLAEPTEFDAHAAGLSEPVPPPKRSQTVPRRARGAGRALLLGLLALPAAALSFLPDIWIRIPATLVGFAALMAGLLAVGEIRSSRGRKTGMKMAGTGIVLGIAAMLLGPFVFAPFGESWRLRHGRRQTHDNLQQVGDALDAYYREHERFPPGTTYAKGESGGEVPLHNWQTMLLPHLGDKERRLYERIDLTKPYDDDANRRVMQQNVPAFFAADADRTKTAAGFAVTHFVALGGTTDVDGVGRVNVGIFWRNSRISRDDVTDGAANTLVAGEIAFDYPPWGEPENYRSIGEGLNRSRDGFGNADRTGAMFLRADGSVRFLSNKIDPDVLRKLSTRDGGEQVDLPPGY